MVTLLVGPQASSFLAAQSTIRQPPSVPFIQPGTESLNAPNAIVTPDAQPAIGIPQPNSAPSADLAAKIAEGKKLEQAGHWLDAMAHYEELKHEFPKSEKLKLRYMLSQIHVDLERRIVDQSYLRMNSTMSESQAKEAFNEVLLKVQSHYVTEPSWQSLTWRGTANLDIALTKQAVRDRYLPSVDVDRINTFRHRLRNDINRRRITTREEARELVYYAARLAQQDLGLQPTATINEYSCGAIASLDRYSTYLSGGQLDDVYNQIEGNFVGLGIELKAEEDALLIVKVIKNGPAAKAGIEAGDRITAVDKVATETITSEQAAEMLKGEQGTIVSVEVTRQDGSRRTMPVRRERVEVPCVEQISIVDAAGGIGYFKLTSFQKTTSRDVDAALWELQRKGMRSLIIDLRGNPGGLLTASVEVSDKFLTAGTIVSTRGRSAREDFDYKAHRAGTWRVPLVILVDRDTASASEILAAAIRDHGRGTVVGERSYGKGSVQGIFPLSTARAGVRLTTAKFYSPNGRAISDQGVSPHLDVSPKRSEIQLSSDTPDMTDPVISAALDTAKQLTLANRN